MCSPLKFKGCLDRLSVLTGKGESVSRHNGVVGEDARGKVGSCVQSLGIHLASKAA